MAMNNLSMRRSQRHSCSALPTMNNNNNNSNNNNNNSNISSSSSNSRENADKTDRPFRRRRSTSFGKLSQFLQTGSILGDAGSIQSALLDMSTTAKLMTKIAESQRRGVESLVVWAHNAGNAAIDDVMQQTRHLYEIFIDKELQFVRQYTHYIQQLQKIADAERAVKDAEVNVINLEEKEKKLRREIGKGVSFFRQRRGGDIYLLKQKLEETKASRQQAEQILSDLRAEMEVVKMFRFRNGMQGIADAYQDLAGNCQAIFNCQREIIEMVPAVSDQDVRHMIYRGSSLTRDRVENLRRSLQHGLTVSENNSWSSSTVPVPKRHSEPRHHVYQLQNNSPPPPYTSSATPRNTSLPEYQIEATDYRVGNAELQTCSHCGQSIQKSPNYQLKRTVMAGDVKYVQ
ncbi:RNA polymerase principal sigma factor HrdC [Dirofilaria immitis]